MPQQGGDVVEQDAGLREIRDAADMAPRSRSCRGGRSGFRSWPVLQEYSGHPDRPAARRRAKPLKASAAPRRPTIRAATVRSAGRARPGRAPEGPNSRGGFSVAPRRACPIPRRGLGDAAWQVHLGRMSRIAIAVLVGLSVSRLCRPGAGPADHVLTQHWALQVPFFLVAGIVWAFPAKWLMFWAAGHAEARRRRKTRRPWGLAGFSAMPDMVGARGFEPPAPASRTQCSTRLSYAPSVGHPPGRRRPAPGEAAI